MSDRPTSPGSSRFPRPSGTTARGSCSAESGVPGGDTTNIFTTLVRHPRLFRHWLPFGGALLTGSLPARDREILILRTAWLCRSDYEWGQHVTIALTSGLTPGEVAAISDDLGGGSWSVLELALLQAVAELHDDNCVGDAHLARARRPLRRPAARRGRHARRPVPPRRRRVELVRGASVEPGVPGFPGEPNGDGSRAGPTGRFDGHTMLVVGAGTQPSDDPDASTRQRSRDRPPRRAGRRGGRVRRPGRGRRGGDRSPDRRSRRSAVAVVGDVTDEGDCEALAVAADGRRQPSPAS